MVTSQHPQQPDRRPPGDTEAPPAATATDNDSTPANPHEHTPGHPNARGTLPMARYLTDPATEDEIQALAAQAPQMSIDQAARLARLLRLNRRPADRAA